MRLLDRYIVGKIGPPAIAAAVVISVVVMGGAVRSQLRGLTDRIPMTQIAVLDIVRIAFYALPTLVGYLFPITFLLGIMVVFSRLAQRNELTAMKAAGVPLKRLVLPVVLLGAVLSGLAFVTADRLQPWAFGRLMRLVTTEMPLRMSMDVLPTGVMHEIADWRVYVGRREPDGVLRDIVILQPEATGANAFYADSARIRTVDNQHQLELQQGLFIPNDPHRHFMFKSLSKTPPTPDTGRMPDLTEGMTIQELFKTHASLDEQFEKTGALPVAIELRRLRLEIKNRLAFPLMCLAVSIVGAPIGARSRRAGQSYAFTIGLTIIIVYFVLRKVVELPLLLPLSVTIALGQIPNLLLCLLGGILIWQVDRV